jgi:hypothetical protein
MVSGATRCLTEREELKRSARHADWKPELLEEVSSNVGDTNGRTCFFHRKLKSDAVQGLTRQAPARPAELECRFTGNRNEPLFNPVGNNIGAERVPAGASGHHARHPGIMFSQRDACSEPGYFFGRRGGLQNTAARRS